MDDQNVPRRLRRFLRKGEPIPENLLPKTAPDNEPWNQPAVTAQAKSNIAISARKASEEAMVPRHRGKRFQEMQKDAFNATPATPIDKAIGLEKKAQFQEHLPSASNKAIEMKKSEIQKALDEIRHFRENTTSHSNETIDQMAEHIAEQNKSSQKAQEEKGMSFHFTPIGGAPNPVDAKKLVTNPEEQKPSSATPIPIPDMSKLSARERMEFRRQQRGQSVPTANPPVAAPAQSNTRPAPAAPASNEPRSHIRRRMGQVDSSEAVDSRAAPTAEEENMTPEAEEDFKDLFADDSKSAPKKKMKKPADEELDEEEDMELFEEEK